MFTAVALFIGISLTTADAGGGDATGQSVANQQSSSAVSVMTTSQVAYQAVPSDVDYDAPAEPRGYVDRSTAGGCEHCVGSCHSCRECATPCDVCEGCPLPCVGDGEISCGILPGSTCNMPAHTQYYPTSHGGYYFRPYQAEDIYQQQRVVEQWGGDPRMPYQDGVFETVYATFEREGAIESTEKMSLSAPLPGDMSFDDAEMAAPSPNDNPPRHEVPVQYESTKESEYLSAAMRSAVSMEDGEAEEPVTQEIETSDAVDLEVELPFDLEQPNEDDQQVDIEQPYEGEEQIEVELPFPELNPPVVEDPAPARYSAPGEEARREQDASSSAPQEVHPLRPTTKTARTPHSHRRPRQPHPQSPPRRSLLGMLFSGTGSAVPPAQSAPARSAAAKHWRVDTSSRQ